jgi:hypothetical protein
MLALLRRKKDCMIPVTFSNVEQELVPPCNSYPIPGLYLSVMTNVETIVIDAIQEKKGKALVYVIGYWLLHMDTQQTYFFTETYYMSGKNPRTEAFSDYVATHLPYHVDDCEMVGTCEQVTIDWDIVGGLAYPVITERTFIAPPPDYYEDHREEYLKDQASRNGEQRAWSFDTDKSEEADHEEIHQN